MKEDLFAEIQNDVISKVHKAIEDEIHNIPGNSTKKGPKKGKGKSKKKKNEEDDEKEDEETQKELESKKMDRLLIKKSGINLPSRRDNFSEMVK